MAKLLDEDDPKPKTRRWVMPVRLLASVAMLAFLFSRIPDFSLHDLVPDPSPGTFAWLAGAVPHRDAGGKAAASIGRNAREMLEAALPAYLLVGGVEPWADSLLPQAAETLGQAQLPDAIGVHGIAGHHQRAVRCAWRQGGRASRGCLLGLEGSLGFPCQPLDLHIGQAVLDMLHARLLFRAGHGVPGVSAKNDGDEHEADDRVPIHSGSA